MKLKNKIFTLLSVFTLVGLTNSFTLKDLNAALTAPTGIDYKYVYDGIFTFELQTGTGTTISAPEYTRTTDDIYYNYSVTYEVIDGLQVTQTFNRSNTSWTGGTPGYYPTDTKIGSNSTVGTVQKIRLIFNNQSTNNFLLYLDYSSTGTDVLLQMFYNGDRVYSYLSSQLIYNTFNQLSRFPIPAGYSVDIRMHDTSSIRYFDAWYLKDLGVSASYDAGVDAGYGQGQDDADLLVTGFQAMVGILVNFLLLIVNLEVFGISILSVFSILALFVGIIWILKIIRG